MTKKKEEKPTEQLEAVAEAIADVSLDPANWAPVYKVGACFGSGPLKPNQRPAYWHNDKAGLQSQTMPECCSGVYDEYGFKVKKS